MRTTRRPAEKAAGRTAGPCARNFPPGDHWMPAFHDAARDRAVESRTRRTWTPGAWSAETAAQPDHGGLQIVEGLLFVTRSRARRRQQAVARRPGPGVGVETGDDVVDEIEGRGRGDVRSVLVRHDGSFRGRGGQGPGVGCPEATDRDAGRGTARVAVDRTRTHRPVACGQVGNLARRHIAGARHGGAHARPGVRRAAVGRDEGPDRAGGAVESDVKGARAGPPTRR